MSRPDGTDWHRASDRTYLQSRTREFHFDQVPMGPGNEPENSRRVRSIILPKDYVRFQLTGERAIDMADASGTLLLDVAHRCWSKEMLELAAIDESPLPSLYESPENLRAMYV